MRNGYPGIPVHAWLRFPNCAELVEGEVFAWAERAAEVTWKDGPLAYRTWVGPQRLPAVENQWAGI